MSPTHFVPATLERNEPGAQYEGVVYDRFLRIRPPSGRVLEVFDIEPPLAGQLEPGRSYDFLLVATLLREPRVGDDPGAPWRGTIIDLAWSPPADVEARDRLRERHWLLIETEVGRLVSDRNEIPGVTEPGQHVTWREARLDLYGFAQTQGPSDVVVTRR